MSLVKLGLDQGEKLLGKLNPKTVVAFWNTNYKHHVFEMSGKYSRFFPENGIRIARLYIVLQNLPEAHHLYHKHSLHL